jgi:hypothetical protein
VGFTPDFVWIKNRTDATNNHNLFDTVRGVNKFLASNLTSAETTQSETLTSFDSDGFTVRNAQSVNRSGYPIVGWCWDAGDNQPSTGHSSVIYRATGSPLKVSGFGFNPDLVWIKSRSNVGNHGIWDSVRGASNVLKPNLTDAESSSSGVTSFDADGYTLGSSFNASGGDYIAWGWDAGDDDPVTNTNGSITSTVKASDATGFSIVSYTGTGANATVGHGLSSAPEMVIAKNRDVVKNWAVGTTKILATEWLSLNQTIAAGNATTTWNSTYPSSSVISVGTATTTNASGQDYIAYCFHSVAGYSKIDSYTGTNSTGNSVTTGFRPGFVMIKNASASASWNIIDSTRSPFSTTGNGQFQDRLFPNASSAESTNADVIEFTDTGFVINA